MNISAVRSLIADDFSGVDRLIQEKLRSDVVLINQLGQYIINSGGKRLRPILVLLAARACNYTGNKHLDLAAVIEFIHTATLLHDDVVDESTLRRSRETANHIWGNQASVLVGDFLYSRAFQMMVEVGNFRVMEIMADTTNMIAEGEVLQLINAHDADTTESAYLAVIHRKTAKLFEAAARLGAVLAGCPPETEKEVAAYGLALGTAFQLVDDVLDYSADPETMGKNIGDDLAEGKPTLPLIHAMQHGTDSQKMLVRRAIEAGGLDFLPGVVEAIASTGAIEYTMALAKRQVELAQNALSCLPESPYKQALLWLARFSVERDH